MSPTSALPVVAGLDGSRAGSAAADWAAREALLRGVPLRLVHAWDHVPTPYATLAGVAVPPDPGWSERLLAEARESLARRHPELRIDTARVCGDPATALVDAASEAELLVLGSRGLGRTTGLLLGSVSRAVVARTGHPVVLVRPEDSAEQAEDDSLAVAGAPVPDGDVVVGVDPDRPDDAVLAFAFDAAARRGTGLRVIHGRTPAAEDSAAGFPRADDLATAAAPLEGAPADVLRPWQRKFPGVPVTAQAVVGRAGSHLVDASRHAALLVVGRAGRQAALGAHIGPVTDAVLHHAAAPVAVVPHD
ncbi:universal stress protein [Streptomyces sp. NPDC005526]|uniref:universal stress protein n=1 Tax=Streptomyces sp. NPDC005526 TaxID=3156885 RepID=UPI0033B5773B